MLNTEALKSHLSTHKWPWLASAFSVVLLLAALLVPAIHGKLFQYFTNFAGVLPALAWFVEAVDRKNAKCFWIGVVFSCIILLAG